jgi:hypothetical protein
MSEDAAITPANELASGLIASAARRKTCVLILLAGATVGLLVAILNILSDHYQWALQNDFFDIVDAPISSLKLDPFGLVSLIAAITGFDAVDEVIVMICYWSVIALFLASLVCLVRIDVIRDITRDKRCRFMLFCGTFAGMVIGSLNFLSAANGWENPLNQPVSSVMDALQERYGILDSQLTGSGSGTEFILKNTVAVGYWSVIGSLVALVPCVVRILRRRKAAREKLVVRGMIDLCRGGASGQASAKPEL